MVFVCRVVGLTRYLSEFGVIFQNFFHDFSVLENFEFYSARGALGVMLLQRQLRCIAQLIILSDRLSTTT